LNQHDSYILWISAVTFIFSFHSSRYHDWIHAPRVGIPKHLYIYICGIIYIYFGSLSTITIHLYTLNFRRTTMVTIHIYFGSLSTITIHLYILEIFAVPPWLRFIYTLLFVPFPFSQPRYGLNSTIGFSCFGLSTTRITTGNLVLLLPTTWFTVGTWISHF